MNNLILTLKNIPKVGRKSIYYFINELIHMPKDENDIIEMFKILNHKHKRIIIPTIEQIKIANEKAEEIIYKSRAHNIKIINLLDDKFPSNLKDIEDVPIQLFYKGNIENLNKKLSISIIGSRKADKVGIETSYKLGKIFATKDYNVVSGLALGCDEYAHKGALSVKKNTTAVMPCSLDTIYPNQNEKLAQEIIDNNGCLVSEYEIGSILYKNNFIQRDRIESGLSLATVVVQSEINSGTMHTVEYTLKQNRILACCNLNSSLNQAMINENKCVIIDENYNIEDLEVKIKYLNKNMNINKYKQEKFNI